MIIIKILTVFILFSFNAKAKISKAENNKEDTYEKLVNFYHSAYRKKWRKKEVSNLKKLVKNHPDLKEFTIHLQEYENLNYGKLKSCKHLEQARVKGPERLIQRRNKQLCRKIFKTFKSSTNSNKENKNDYLIDKFWEYYEKARDSIDERKFRSAYYWSQKCLNLSDKISVDKIRKRTFFLAKNFLRSKKYKYANNVLEHLISTSKKEQDERIYTYHKLIIASYLEQRKFNKALRFINNNNNMFKNLEELPSSLIFWTALTYQKNQNKSLADTYYDYLIEKRPLSFYTTLTLSSKLKALKKNKRIVANQKLIPKTLNPKSNETKKSIRLLTGFSKTNDFVFVNAAYNQARKKLKQEFLLGSSDAEEESFYLSQTKLFTDLFSKQDLHLFIFKSIYPLINKYPHVLSQAHLDLLFPHAFKETLLNTESAIDKGLVISLIRQESAFNPRAVSSVGAMGLMQLMPLTAKRVQNKVSKKELFKPKVNIEIGVEYLSYLLKKFDNNATYALAAYNAGESRVSVWIKEFLNKNNPLLSLELIPFKETRNYVKLIYRNYFFYQLTSPKIKKKTRFEFEEY